MLMIAVLLIAVTGCSDNGPQQGGVSNPDTTSPGAGGSQGQSHSGEGTGDNVSELVIYTNGIIFDLDQAAVSDDNGLTIAVVLEADVAVGDKVQFVGVGEKPFDAEITALKIGEDLNDSADKGQKATLVFSDINSRDIENMQRVVAAKTKRAGDLKQPETFEDLLGTIENGIYRNECFGFTINCNQPDFQADINAQVGYRDSFGTESGVEDASILYINPGNYAGQIAFTVTKLTWVDKATAQEQLAFQYQQYEITPDLILLTDKEVAHVFIAYQEGETASLEVFAMFLNGYYIEWTFLCAKDSTEQQRQAFGEILGSVSFDWVAE